MRVAAILSIAATLLAHHPVTVHCTPPPGKSWTGRVWGWSDLRSNVWLRHCLYTVRRRRDAEVIFGHEILHILHPTWPHSKVYPASVYFLPAVDRAIVRAKT